MCLFFLRIFRSPAFRAGSYVLIALNAVIGITWALVDSFRCLPVHLAWTQWEGLETGKCINFVDSTLVHSFLNVFVDVAIIVYPLYKTTQLQLSFSKKLGVFIMILLGLVYVLPPLDTDVV